MTTPTTRKVIDLNHLRDDAIIAALNELNAALAAFGVLPHHAPTTAVSDTGTTNLAAVVVIANSAKALYGTHIADTGAHVAADATNVITAPDATSADQNAANTLLNDIKAQFNAHIITRAAHRATYLGELAADLEALKTAYQASLVKLDADAGTGLDTNYAATNPAVAAVNPFIIKTADASNLATSKTLAAAIVIALNRHFGAGSSLLTLVGA